MEITSINADLDTSNREIVTVSNELKDAITEQERRGAIIATLSAELEVMKSLSIVILKRAAENLARPLLCMAGLQRALYLGHQFSSDLQTGRESAHDGTLLVSMSR